MLQLDKLEIAFGDKAKNLNLEEILKSKLEKKDQVPEDFPVSEVSKSRPAVVPSSPYKTLLEA